MKDEKSPEREDAAILFILTTNPLRFQFSIVRASSRLSC